MRKGEATRARILEGAARLAARKGLTAVSLADVAAEAGLSKSGLFKHFDSKEAMQQAVIEHIAERFAGFVWAPVEAIAPGRTRLERIFALQSDWSELEWAESGCPLMAFSVELDDQPGALRDLLRRTIERWRRTVVREFTALRDPVLPEEEAERGYFEMRSFLLGQAESRRLMADAGARRLGAAAFGGLLDRLSRPQVRSESPA